MPSLPVPHIRHANLYHVFISQSSHTGTRNLVLSPILTQAALALLEIGASGHTRDDLSATVQSPLRAITHLTSSLKSINSQQTDIEYVSAVFVSNDGQLNRTFASVANEARSSVVPVNFRQPAQTVQIINSWVSQATRGAIPSIMDQSMCRVKLWTVTWRWVGELLADTCTLLLALQMPTREQWRCCWPMQFISSPAGSTRSRHRNRVSFTRQRPAASPSHSLGPGSTSRPASYRPVGSPGAPIGSRFPMR